MKIIIRSYLKTFIKNWISSLGVLLFIAILAAVSLGMLSTPFQLNFRIKSIYNHSEKYDYRLKDSNKYSEDFSYNFFLLNGNKYASDYEDNLFYDKDNLTLLTQPSQNFKKINPSELNIFIDDILNKPETLPSTYFSKTFYLILNQQLKIYVETTKPSDIAEIKEDSWDKILSKSFNHELNSTQALSYAENLRNVFNTIINTSIYNFQKSATQSYGNYDLNSETSEARRDKILNIFINDLKTNLEIKTKTEEGYFNDYQKLYLINKFLDANKIEKISSYENIDWEQIKEKLLETSKQNNLKIISLLFFDEEFFSIIANQYFNNISNFIFTNALNSKNNLKAFKGQQQLFQIDSAIEFTLSKTTVGSVLPDLSIDLRSSEFHNNFNKIIVEHGNLPSIDIDNNSEILLSSEFMRLNNLKIGDNLVLPESNTFSKNIDPKDEKSYKIGNSQIFKIVGSALKYDELTPGTGRMNFIQPFDTYTYGYIPEEFLILYQKTRFIYKTPTAKPSSDIFMTFRVKNLVGDKKINPFDALHLDLLKSETIFENAESLVVSFNKIKTISSLGNINTQVVIYIILGMASLFLAFIFVNFVIRKEINETRRQLGIFKSFGYTTLELSLIFSIKTLLTFCIGMLVGFFGSLPLQLYMSKNFKETVMFIFQSIYVNGYLLSFIFIVIPALFFLISYLVTLKYLNESPLSLVKNSERIKDRAIKTSWLSRYLDKKNEGFNYRLAKNFIKNSKGKFIVVQTLFVFASLVYTLMFGAQALMYQVIKQGFSLVKKNTDHEYIWNNDNNLTINENSKGKYVFDHFDPNIKTSKSIKYINYWGYKNPNDFLTRTDQLNDNFTNSRFGFRILTDALANTLDQQNPNLKNLKQKSKFIENEDDAIDNWILMPKKMALMRFSDGEIDLEVLDKYYLLNILSFKGIHYSEKLQGIIQEMRTTNQPYKGNLNDLKPKKNSDENEELWVSLREWLNIRFNPESAPKILRETFFGMNPITEYDGKSNEAYNNFFANDLSRIFSMLFAEMYINSKILNYLKEHDVAIAEGKYTKEAVIKALHVVYDEFYNPSSPTANFDIRESKYWKILDNPFLGIKNNMNLKNNDLLIEDAMNTIMNIDSGILGVLNASLLSNSAKDLTSETIVNFNNFFYNSSTEHLQLTLDVNYNENLGLLGPTKLNLIDTSNNRFGYVKNQYNFDKVTSEQYDLLKIKPAEKNTFNGIVPYTVAKELGIKKGDQIHFNTATKNVQEIVVNVVGINNSITFPLNLYWPIFLDYNVFAKEMFSPELQEQIGINEPNKLIDSYYFNNIVSQEKMLSGDFDITNIGKSLKSFSFVGNQLVLNQKPDSMVFGSLLKQAILRIYPEMKEKLDGILNIDKNALLLTDPSLMNLKTKKLVSMPFNITQIGVNNFAKTMNNLMFIFLLLQSILLTIILVIVVNIVIDEASLIILTLRSLGTLQKEINWIIMSPYVIGALISYILAYALSAIAWKVFLVVIQNEWSIYIFFPFSWQGLVIPFLVLGSIVAIGFFSANWNVNRRPLSKVTNFA